MRNLFLCLIVLGFSFLSCQTIPKTTLNKPSITQSKLSPEESNAIKQELIIKGFIGHTLKGAIIGKNLNDTDEYNLSKLNTEGDARFSNYGTIVEFSDNNTFRCHYTAPCGNDCFPYSNGTYKIIDKDKISLLLHETGQKGFCNKEHKIYDIDLGIYKIVIKSNGVIKLVKE